jgi:hypothetical protein
LIFHPCGVDAGSLIRAPVVHWTRTSGAYDSVLDVDRAIADPADPALPRPGCVVPDGAHPDEAGSHAIAAAMNPDALRSSRRPPDAHPVRAPVPGG